MSPQSLVEVEYLVSFKKIHSPIIIVRISSTIDLNLIDRPMTSHIEKHLLSSMVEFDKQYRFDVRNLSTIFSFSLIRHYHYPAAAH
jgi:uncharacterized protein YifN (PemK superfamily)